MSICILQNFCICSFAAMKISRSYLLALCTCGSLFYVWINSSINIKSIRSKELHEEIELEVQKPERGIENIYSNRSEVLQGVFRSKELHEEIELEVQKTERGIENIYLKRLEVLQNVCKEYSQDVQAGLTEKIEDNRFLFAKGLLACSNAKVSSQTMRSVFYSIAGITPKRIYGKEFMLIDAR
ncbi:unnamed protein product, partial [Meganyctiphanes norvegica]